MKELKKEIEKIIGHDPGGCCDSACPAYRYGDGKIPSWLKPGKCSCNLPRMVKEIMNAIKKYA